MSNTVQLQQVLDAIEKLREEVSNLNQRVATLEAGANAAAAQAVRSSAQPASADGEQLSEELVLTISAAIAAYLGLKPHIRQIRLLGSPTWGQQGRVTVQASHALAVHQGGGPLET